MCSVEHFGLGRYGDPIDPMAWENALKSFQRVLKTNGRLYVSVPVGQVNKICFNAHRVYKPQLIIDTLDKMQILEMGYISGFDFIKCIENKDSKICIYDDKIKSIPDMKNFGLTGLFEFIKK